MGKKARQIVSRSSNVATDILFPDLKTSFDDGRICIKPFANR
jgi:hypothetical protein